MELAHFLSGIIFSCFFGLAFGNFATNPIYRLPRRESLFLRDPYCGDCNTKLTTVDLFPVFSWLMTRGKCRYCGAQIPATYAVIEALIGLIFVLCFVKWGFSERFVLVSFGITALIMIASMLYIDNFFSGKTLIAALVMGALYRTLQDRTIYDMAGGAFAGLIVGGSAWRVSGKNLIRDIVSFPAYLDLLVAAGVWLPLHYFLFVCLAAGAAWLLTKNKPWGVEYTIIAVLIMYMLMVLR